ncbi:MAG: 2Fe-2S iron-sulfur cluster binding domain-containing protein [Gammaproteobacteria bacterium]|nr:2Fe-2S iron-sulfur cluster binding domain-containing protein [Gammaproteobacteria bacterium]
MANVTFSSPKLKKDITVYATAGDCSTLLSVAREHSIPVDFECENGECGSCALQVVVLENKQPLGMHLTEKEKTVLKLSGKINSTQIEAAETSDIPPPWRLACQFIVRNEDILVKF